MSDPNFPLDELHPQVQTWLALIAQARRNPAGELVPSFLEIIQQIQSELEGFFKGKLELIEIKTVFSGIAIISYLSEKYAIEKIMMIAKGRCLVSIPSPPELISELIAKFSDSITSSDENLINKMIGRSMIHLLQKNYLATRNACIPLKQHFQNKFEKNKLSILELILYALIRNDVILMLIKSMNTYQSEFGQEPYAIFFSVLKNIVNEIQAHQNQRKFALEGLRNLFDNLAQLEKK